MRDKGFPLLIWIGILTLTSACDNVGWGGVQVEVRAPEPVERVTPVSGEEADEDSQGTPLDTGPLLYLVERGTGAAATLVPIARLTDGGYAPLPDSSGTLHLLARFPLGRWEAGTEFTLFHQATRAGTFVSSGETGEDSLGCSPRATASGWIELHPAAQGARRFLALRKEDRGSLSLPGPHPGLQVTAQMRTASHTMAGVVIPAVGAPWPPSIPEVQRELTPFVWGSGQSGIATSLVYGDDLQVGSPLPLAYGLFLLGEARGTSYRPVWSWYQRADRGGKAFPSLAAAHDVRGTGEPDFLLEVFGESARWWAVAGMQDGSIGLVFQDACGTPAADGSLRAHPG